MFKNKFVLILVFLLVLISGLAIYYYNKVNKLAMTPEIKAQKEANMLVTSVGKLILLPSDEIPTIATVNDIEKLKNQPFFAHAKVGDKVIMYPKSKKAYLYNPTLNVLVDVASVNAGK